MRSLVISEHDRIAAVMENDKAIDFFISRNDLGVGDIYTVTVQNIMPSIGAVFVHLGDGRMGFLHVNDVPGTGDLTERVSPGEKMLVQIIKEPTGKKGPRVDLTLSIPGRYFVLTTDHDHISLSRRITDSAERDRLKSIANLMKPEGVGLVIRTEASGRTNEELEEDFVNLWEIWKSITDKHEQNRNPGLVHREQDFLYSTLRDCFSHTIDEIVVEGIQARYRTENFLKTWTGREVTVKDYNQDEILDKTGLKKELKNCLSNRADLPSGGYVIIQATEALTAIDINSGRFTSSTTLKETVRRTNMEAAVEIARQMRLRNIGGMIIIDFIDMPDRMDRIAVMETLEAAVKVDKAKPQIGQLSDLCLVEITRKRSGQAIVEVFGNTCPRCDGAGIIFKLRDDDKDSSHSSKQNRYNNKDNRDRRSGNNSRNNRNQRQGGRDRDNRERRYDNRRSSTQQGFQQQQRQTQTKEENKKQSSNKADNDSKSLTESKTFSSQMGAAKSKDFIEKVGATDLNQEKKDISPEKADPKKEAKSPKLEKKSEDDGAGKRVIRRKTTSVRKRLANKTKVKAAEKSGPGSDEDQSKSE